MKIAIHFSKDSQRTVAVINYTELNDRTRSAIDSGDLYGLYDNEDGDVWAQNHEGDAWDAITKEPVMGDFDENGDLI